jgi:hypothetical protein
MGNKFENVQELIAMLEQLGLLDEFEEKVEAQKLKVRNKLLRDRFILRGNRNSVLPALGKEAKAATEALKLAEENVLKARQAYNAVMTRSYGATVTYSEDKINFEIEKAAPKFMHDAYDQLGEMHDFLGGTVRSWRVREPDAWNYRTIDMSNVKQITSLREECRAGQEKIRELMYDVETPCEEQRRYCTAIVAKCVEATHPQLKDDKEWLAYQEKNGKSKK